jgi:hypothetical protein
MRLHTFYSIRDYLKRIHLSEISPATKDCISSQLRKGNHIHKSPMERQKMRTQADKEDLDIRVISSSNEIAQMESDWNALVKTSCDNPFLLSEFARQIVNSKLSTGWAPLVLIVSASDNIIGISPFMTKMKFGVRFVKFVYRSTLLSINVEKHASRALLNFCSKL